MSREKRVSVVNGFGEGTVNVFYLLRKLLRFGGLVRFPLMLKYFKMLSILFQVLFLPFLPCFLQPHEKSCVVFCRNHLHM